ncbi:MAG: phosphate acyltransferase PlsX [Bacteroidetes bacterium]|nr:phosphate acyltransferase PlsX [Bacteroidota bacterium]MBV6461430.1 Phosphate acyltransferase [Flavobacteriales bacterium]WKZ76572.1 MAG: phosphate acyltransferase PlsX [Vicingaceae bacterium]MCL4815607.1 phosphate acyltransferase PlsX [Flavobacteriales bacterium]NOG94255.1 phosphate acyltransferase PlsX [Bacteroidota bacterium]
MKIALDIMGGDYAPLETTRGAIIAQKELAEQGVKLVLIGDKPSIEAIIIKDGASVNDFEIVHTTEVIGMAESPTRAFSQKPNSSITVGFGLLKSGQVQAFASAGNTGAMLVGSVYSVKNIPGVIRPCITSLVPKVEGGYNIILDIGANADCKPDVLYQFGILGSLYSKYVLNVTNPKVGLLNIGEEDEKGNLVSLAAHQLMREGKDFNFVGNVESRELFNNKADVIVCDGFTGNIVLKQAEAFYDVAMRRGIKDDFFSRFNYENYGGSPILGINSNVIVGHGISNAKAIKSMLLLSKNVAEAKLSEIINKAFND